MPEPLRVAGRVLESLPNALYRVELQSEGRPRVTAHVSGQASLLRLLPGEAVEVELSAYDGSRARIVAKT
jgi:translation initiation factor IF-1